MLGILPSGLNFTFTHTRWPFADLFAFNSLPYQRIRDSEETANKTTSEERWERGIHMLNT